jgi:hypothetical protein
MPVLLQALRETHDRAGKGALVRPKRGVPVKPYGAARRRRDLHRRASTLVRADESFFARKRSDGVGRAAGVGRALGRETLELVGGVVDV